MWWNHSISAWHLKRQCTVFFPLVHRNYPNSALKTQNKTFVFKNITIVFKNKAIVSKNKAFVLRIWCVLELFEAYFRLFIQLPQVTTFQANKNNTKANLCAGKVFLAEMPSRNLWAVHGRDGSWDTASSVGTAMLLASCSSAEPVSSTGCGAKFRKKT